MRLFVKEPPKGWYRWYAWHPVWCKANRAWAWLEYVDRSDFGYSTYMLIQP